MTPKRYSQKSLLIRWAYLFEEVRPLQTSTCALFWRAVVLSPIKVIGPALIVIGAATGVLLAFFGTVVDWLWPDWLHQTGFFTPEHSHGSPTDWTPLLIMLAIVGAGAIVGWTGLLGMLHKLCVPVEIEGGLVQKGMCPGPCTGRMIVQENGTWRCRKCHGRFTPATSDAASSGSLEGQQ